MQRAQKLQILEAGGLMRLDFENFIRVSLMLLQLGEFFNLLVFFRCSVYHFHFLL